MKYIYIVATVSALSACSVASKRKDDPNEVAKIRTLVDQYTMAVNHADTALAATIWNTTGNISFIHPLGYEKGWTDIKNNVYVKLMGGLFYERKLTVDSIEIHVQDQAAWAEFYWDFKASMRADSSAVNTKGRETQLYVKEDSGWKLVHVHYSGMPVSETLQGL